MNKVKSFLMGVVLLIITFAVIMLAALIYRANERSSIKSYIFQVNNFANQRVGELQNINNISPEDLRNKLIQKYISEYFRVTPGEQDVENRQILKDLSSSTAYAQWQQGEATIISEMSSKNMFRMVHVYDDGIATLNRPSDYDYKNSDIVKPIYYAVRYYTETWTEPNKMGAEPIQGQGIINIEARFRPGILDDINIQKYLEEGKNPVGLFKFEVTNIESKDAR